MTTTERCRDCIYSRTNGGPTGIFLSCDYILIEGHRRGCPAGDDCDKYIQQYSQKARRTHLPVAEAVIFEMYYKGMTDKDISAALGVSRHVIANWRKKWSLPSSRMTRKDCET